MIRIAGERREVGSVLVEAMVAVAIVAMMLAATYRAVGESVLRSRAAQTSRTASLIAQSHLAAVGAEIPLTPGETTGVDGNFNWRVEIDPEPAGSSNMGALWRVTATVRDQTDKVDRVTLWTLRTGGAG